MEREDELDGGVNILCEAGVDWRSVGSRDWQE
jgi:hypothetical protein